MKWTYALWSTSHDLPEGTIKLISIRETHFNSANEVTAVGSRFQDMAHESVEELQEHVEMMLRCVKSANLQDVPVREFEGFMFAKGDE